MSTRFSVSAQTSAGIEHGPSDRKRKMDQITLNVRLVPYYYQPGPSFSFGFGF